MPKKSAKTVNIIFTEGKKLLSEQSVISLVRRGYAKNFLFPSGKAIAATKENVKQAEERLIALKKQRAKDKEIAEHTHRKINNSRLDILVEADEKGHLYGSVQPKDVVEAIQKSHAITIDPILVQIDLKVKTTCICNITIALHAGVLADILLNIYKKDDDVKALWKQYDDENKETKK